MLWCVSWLWSGAWGDFSAVTAETEAAPETDAWEAIETDVQRVERGSDGFATYAFVSIGMTAAMLCLGLVLMRALTSHRKELTRPTSRRTSLTENQFERQILTELGVAPGSTPLPAPAPREAVPRAANRSDKPDPPAAALVPDSALRGSLEMGDSVLAAVERMRAANLVSDETPTPVGAEIPGACILRLRSGKRVLVAPSDTALDRVFTMTNLCDSVVLARDDGSAILCRSLAEFIAESVFHGG
ncbi:hypothetical protein JW916_07675 [Candidatus Sumerlaeota bacterium]|nr:hypothetical protein [Candidatus Sumerlaeota bacterium]